MAKRETQAVEQLEQTGGGYCLVCGLVFANGDKLKECKRCKVPRGSTMDPNDVTSSTALVYTGHAPRIIPVQPLQSPRASISYSAADWNWGAAICSTWWAFRQRSWAWAVICLLNLALWVNVALILPSSVRAGQNDPNAPGTFGGSAVSLLLFASVGFWFCKTFYLGIRGNQIAARSGRYQNETSMSASLHKWNINGGRIGGLFLVLLFCEIIWAVTR